MQRFTLAACAGLLAATMAVPSYAADLPRPAYKAPVYTAPLFTWSGFYVGANGGYGWGTSSWTGGAVATGNFDVTGWLFGATLGYNFQTGSFVFGVEGDIDWSNIKGASTTTCAAPGCETKLTWLGTARGRIGYSFDRFLPFFTGGAAFGGIKMTPPPPGTSETETRIGWTLGGGLEYAFAGNLSAKVEYLYVDLGTASCSATACGGARDVTFKSNIVKGGINYRF